MLSALRSSGPLADVVATLNAFPDVVGERAQLRTRTVAFFQNEKWWNHATTTVLEAATEQGAAPVLRLRDLALVEAVQPLDGNLTRDLFEAHLTAWREQLKALPRFTFQEPVQVDRDFSGPSKAQYPQWASRLHEMVLGATGHTLPAGPFLAGERGVFAPDAPSLTAHWLGESFWKSRTSPAYEYRLRIEDRRARISSLVADDDGLTVTVDGICHEPLYCGASIKTLAGNERLLVEPVVSSRARLEFGESVQDLSIWVMLADGQSLDGYSESPHWASWGARRALYNRPRAEGVERTPLDVALAGGETETVEFKPYIRLSPHRDSKADELLETVSAFANAGGGTLFLGVTDYAEPIGIDADLRKAYGQRCSGDPTCLRESYIKDLKKLLNEGLKPAVIPEFSWYDPAQRWVLAAVVQGSGVAVSLIANGDVFARVGATNRKLRPADLIE